MATYTLDLNDMNYSTKVLSYYLWGQESAPSASEIADAQWIDRTDTVTLKIDPTQFLETCGHLVNAKDFKLVDVFFSGKTAGGNALNLSNVNGYTKNAKGEYELTQEQFEILYYGKELNNQSRIASISLYNRGTEDADFAKRAFVFGTISAQIVNAKYILDANLNPLRIDNFDIKLSDDNFDFTGGSGSGLANEILTQVADPSGIGEKVLFDFGGGAVKTTSVLTKQTYDLLTPRLEDGEVIQQKSLFYEEFKRMLDTGVMNYLDENGKVVIFGTNGDETISGTQAKNFDLSKDISASGFLGSLITFFKDFNHFKQYVANGITYVGGAGSDTINGTSNDDILDGGTNDDTLKGGVGNDTYYFQKGYNQDIVDDTSGNDKLLFGKDITQEDLLVKVSGDDLVVSFKNSTEDSITLKNWYTKENRIEYFEFSNGVRLDENGIIKLMGTKDVDVVRGTDGNNDIVGNDSADKLEGGDGYDTYHADDGDTVSDSDGNGRVVYNGDVLSGGVYNKDTGKYEGDGGTYTKTADGYVYESPDGKKINLNVSNDTLGLHFEEAPDDDPLPDPNDGNANDTTNNNHDEDFSSPLILDLNHDDTLSTTLYNSPTYFDMDGDGFAEKTA